MARSGAWTAAAAAAQGGTASIIPSRKRSPLRAPLYGTVSAAAIAAALLWPGSAAYAICSGAAPDGNGNPNGQTINCTGVTNPPGSTAAGGANVGYGDTTNGPQNNIINVANGASVAGSASLSGFGFALGTGNTIFNGGTISAGGFVIDAFTSANSTLTVNNNAGGIITSTSATGAGVQANE